VHLLNTLSYLGQGHRFFPRDIQRCGDHVIGECWPAATVMAAHQAAYAAGAPCVLPVVDRLPAHVELQGDGFGFESAPKQQKGRRSCARVPMHVIDRHLLQGQHLGFAQFYCTPHWPP
jgi:hypothetical protein